MQEAHDPNTEVLMSVEGAQDTENLSGTLTQPGGWGYQERLPEGGDARGLLVRS